MRKILLRLALFALSAAVVSPAQDTRRAKRVLILTHSAGYVHDVVKRPAPDQLSFAEKELTEILRPGWTVDCTQDCSVLTAEKLAAYDVVAFYTTGELPAPKGGAEALIQWVRNGGGFVGIHCAADTWYTVPAYGDMLGGVFDAHPWNQRVRLIGENWESFEITDEIYQFKKFDRDPLSVLLSLDLASVDPSKGTRPDKDYVLAWQREYGNGRVAYVALGHHESTWKDENFRGLLQSKLRSVAEPWLESPLSGNGGARILLPRDDPPFTQRDGSPVKWTHDNGRNREFLQVVPKTGDIVSKEKFGDFRLHLEFRVPVHPPEDQGQARGNSGVYLQDRYEIQVLDSYGLVPQPNDCGAIYAKKAPSTNACRKPGEWQSYDARFTAARWDATGKKTANARVTVWQNGIKIHDDVEIDGPTGGGEAETPGPGPLRLQDHGDLVSYRNVWVVPR
jgi:type 1 glutamine amidotransferase